MHFYLFVATVFPFSTVSPAPVKPSPFLLAVAPSGSHRRQVLCNMQRRLVHGGWDSRYSTYYWRNLPLWSPLTDYPGQSICLYTITVPHLPQLFVLLHQSVAYFYGWIMILHSIVAIVASCAIFLYLAIIAQHLGHRIGRIAPLFFHPGVVIYRISSKSHHTSKSCRPQNLTASFSVALAHILFSIITALALLTHQMGPCHS